MQNIKDKLLQIANWGIDLKHHLIGDPKTGGLLKEVQSYTDEDTTENWIILREMGNQCHWFNKSVYTDRENYSDDVSTILYEDYFFYNTISYFFQELQRITKGAFTYEVIDEFLPIYDADNNTIENGFWNKLDELKGNFKYTCKYRIRDRYLELDYQFLNYSWTYLNPAFVDTLVELLQLELTALNVSILPPEEFITFVVCNTETKNKLQHEMGIQFKSFELPSFNAASSKEEHHLHESEDSTPTNDHTINKNETIASQAPSEQELEPKKWWQFWK